MEMTWKLVVGIMQGHTTGTSTTAGSRVVVEAMLSVGVDKACFDLIVTVGSVMSKSV